MVEGIIKQLNESGKAKYDFGTFYLKERKNGIVKTFSGETKKVAPYQAVFFRASQKLKRGIKKL